MSKVTHINQAKKKPRGGTWSHVCPGRGLITQYENNVSCRCGARRSDKNQNGAA